ncbi:MAG: hypothetical protein AABY15_09760, partial [Nanoarchaeota archaeon]
MKKGVLVCLLLILIFTSFVSAGFFQDLGSFFAKMTGRQGETCIDTDKTTYPTIDYGEQGTATLGSSSSTDYCSGNTLIEAYCESSTSKKLVGYTCPSGYACSNGACVSQQGCVPATCSSLGYSCGSVSDGCGSTL